MEGDTGAQLAPVLPRLDLQHWLDPVQENQPRPPHYSFLSKTAQGQVPNATLSSPPVIKATSAAPESCHCSHLTGEDTEALAFLGRLPIHAQEQGLGQMRRERHTSQACDTTARPLVLSWSHCQATEVLTSAPGPDEDTALAREVRGLEQEPRALSPLTHPPCRGGKQPPTHSPLPPTSTSAQRIKSSQMGAGCRQDAPAWRSSKNKVEQAHHSIPGQAPRAGPPASGTFDLPCARTQRARAGGHGWQIHLSPCWAPGQMPDAHEEKILEDPKGETPRWEPPGSLHQGHPLNVFLCQQPQEGQVNGGSGANGPQSTGR